MSVENLASGVLLLRNYVSLDDQWKIINYTNDNLNHFKVNDEWNYPDKRGVMRARCYRKLDDYPTYFVELAHKIKEDVEAIDRGFGYEPFTHVLTNLYPDKDSCMGWHVDDINNHDSKVEAPVYSLSIGNSALFKYSLVEDKRKIYEIILNSGDLLVFGKNQRLMPHCLKKVFKNTFGGYDNRINFTFRSCPGLTEEEYAAAQTHNYIKTK
jgi:alkylated DNA repair dioxygenase AlkB